ncbi:MAG: 50S ribosomal protein L25 [Planctomycetes bacterium]|nr:50S ribosomal protein L25 [Planctomycetota bacterium]
MKHETPTITAEPRERVGTRYAQRLRKTGRLPAVVYGHKTSPVSVSVDEKEILTHIQHGAHAMYLDIAGGKKETCLVKDLQYGYLGDNVIHVDFTRVNFDEEVEVKVHLDFVGQSHEAARADAILRHDHTELAVRCKVSDIPDELKVDLGHMHGAQLHASELPLPPNVTLAEDPETLIASVHFLRADVEEVGEEAEVEAGGAEPEVITEGKPDDDASAGGTESS